MKMKKFLWHTLLVCAAASAAMAQDPGPDAGSKVLALERLWAQAAELRDFKAMDQLFDDAFVLVDIDGRLLNKAAIMNDPKLTNSMQVVVESKGTHLHANTVIVTGILHFKGVDRGRPDTRRGRFVDTWLYKQAHWVCIASVTTPLEP